MDRRLRINESNTVISKSALFMIAFLKDTLATVIIPYENKTSP